MSSTPPDTLPTALDHIWALSVQDRRLASRRAHKARAAKETQSPAQFVQALRDTREEGKAFSCRMTQAWVTEVFEGLESQYVEYKYDDGGDGSKAGYRVLQGDGIRGFFQGCAESATTVIHHLRHTGTEDHAFTVEQLPRGQGYRIYQSYGGAYSLRAWLSSTTHGLFAEDTGEIIVWKQLHAEVNEELAKLTGGRASLAQLDALPEELKVLRPYCEFVRDYDKGQIMANFERSWSRYGQGRVLTQAEFFDDYLVKLARLETYLRQHDHQPTPFPREIWDMWIELYASPTSLHFPQLPHELITDLSMPGRDYRLELLDVVLPVENEALRSAFAANARVLRTALGEP